VIIAHLTQFSHHGGPTRTCVAMRTRGGCWVQIQLMCKYLGRTVW
jgi:hypothetical protein